MAEEQRQGGGWATALELAAVAGGAWLIVRALSSRPGAFGIGAAAGGAAGYALGRRLPPPAPLVGPQPLRLRALAAARRIGAAIRRGMRAAAADVADLGAALRSGAVTVEEAARAAGVAVEDLVSALRFAA
jgi:hypothetical protein